MSVEDRLFALAVQCRQQSGDSFLRTAGQLAPRLNSQAPDLHAEIRALAAAFEMGAAARIANAPNPEAEAAAVSSEIAVRERLSMASVGPAIAVARRIGPLSAGAVASPSTPTPGGWAGDSMAVGAAPAAPHQPAAPPPYQPQPAAPAYTPGYQMPGQPAPPPQGETTDKLKALTKNPLAMGAAALVIGLLVYQNFMKPQPQQPPFQQGGEGGGGVIPQPPPVDGGGGQQPPVNSGQYPTLQPAGSGGPTLSVQRHSSGAPGFMFMMPTQGGAAAAMVLLPQGGWQTGPVAIGIAQPGDTTGQNVATMGQGQSQLVQSNGHPVRLAQTQMSQNNLGVTNLCLMFRGQQGQQDVQLSGADFCVMDGPCSQPIGCGKLQ